MGKELTMSKQTEFTRLTSKAVSLYAEAIKAKKDGLHFVMIGMTGESLRNELRAPTVDDLIFSIKTNKHYATMPDLQAAAIRWIEENRE